MFSDILSYFDILWTTKERTDSSIVETIHVLKSSQFLKHHRKVPKQMNPLQVNNLITNKSLAKLKPLEEF
jgi:hypothetical protein